LQVSEHYSASGSKPKENTRSANNTSELQGYHTARNALDNIMQKLYLVIEHKCCEAYCHILRWYIRCLQIGIGILSS